MTSLLLGLVVALAAGDPVEVVEHTVDLRIGATVTTATTWTVRVDDPAALGAGWPAPAELDGASSRGAAVRNGLLTVPASTAPGTTFTLSARQRGPGGSTSGEWLLPGRTAHAELTVQGPADLIVWSDDGAMPVSVRPGRLQLTWDDVESAQVVWSTWPSWPTASEDLTAWVDERVVSPYQFGSRRLGSDITGLTIGGAVERVADAIALVPAQGPARTAREAASDGEASAEERALILISILRGAGHDARMVRWRPAGLGHVPVSVPAPALLPRPGVAVLKRDEVVWIDPASDIHDVSEVPTTMRGGVAWIPGDVPVRLDQGGVVDGTVTVTAQVNLSRDGTASWAANLVATGVAQSRLRELLQSGDDRQDLFADLLRQAHPAIDRVAVQFTGIDVDRPLRITLQAHEPDALGALGPGLVGELDALLAGTLAEALPPRVLVREELAITPPGALRPLATSLPQSRAEAGVITTRTVVSKGARVVLTTEIERPGRVDPPGLDQALQATMDAGLVLLLQPVPDRTQLKALHAADDHPMVGARLTEALLLWSVGDDRHARKVLTGVLRHQGPDAVADQLALLAHDDPRPWLALFDLSTDPSARLRAVYGLEAAGDADTGWRLAASLTAASDPEVRLGALLAMERMIGPQPDLRADPSGHAAWLSQDELLQRAEELTRVLPEGAAALVPVQLRRAEQALATGHATEAEVLLEAVLEQGSSPAAEVLLAEAAANSGVAEEDVVSRISSAVARAPYDAVVARSAARAMARVGHHAEALEHGLTAARLSHDDRSAWDEAVRLALTAGDLPAALYASRRASDLDPDDPDTAERLYRVATLARDHQQLSVSAARLGRRPSLTNWPPDLHDLVALAGDDALLATLEFHDTEVVADPTFLEVRAQLRLEARDLDGAARDGMLLAHVHGRPVGYAIAWAATASHTWSPAAVASLREHQNDPVVRAALTEHALLVGSPDLLALARQGRDDPRAVALLEVVRAPEASLPAGWPADLPEPRGGPPEGFTANPVLGASPGVSAWSRASDGLAVVRVGGITGILPAPLAQLYTPADIPTRTLPDGSQVVRLDGGIAPLFAAVGFRDGEEVYGLGRSVRDAVRALEAAP